MAFRDLIADRRTHRAAGLSVGIIAVLLILLAAFPWGALRETAARQASAQVGRPVTIGRNVWIGGGAIILPGVVIEDDAVVGAGSVVTRHVARASTVVGNPARAR